MNNAEERVSDAERWKALQDYIGFDERDASRLRRLGAYVSDSFEEVVDAFHAAIQKSDRAQAAFPGGAPQVARQRVMLRRWLSELFDGRYGDDYFARRRRIGRVHVRIGLDQELMFGGMNIIRTELHRALERRANASGHEEGGHAALDRLLDLELAVMLDTYQESQRVLLARSERLSTIGQLAANIGHELRNPLAVIETSLHLWRRAESPDIASKHLERVAAQVRLCGEIIDDLVAMAQDYPPHRQAVPVESLVQQALSSTPFDEGITFRIRVPEGFPPLWVDGSQMRQVLVNLLTNAGQAVGADGRIELSARVIGAGVELRVCDDGPGFAADLIDRAFEPLVTSKRSGIGLGLALCRRIVDNHGGRIEANNRPEGGAELTIRLPHRPEAE